MLSFSRSINRITNFAGKQQNRKYWIEPVKPSRDIVTTITHCALHMITFRVRKMYTNYSLGDKVCVTRQELLKCSEFDKIKKHYENESFTIYIHETDSMDSYAVEFDSFKKIINIWI